MYIYVCVCVCVYLILDSTVNSNLQAADARWGSFAQELGLLRIKSLPRVNPKSHRWSYSARRFAARVVVLGCGFSRARVWL